MAIEGNLFTNVRQISYEHSLLGRHRPWYLSTRLPFLKPRSKKTTLDSTSRTRQEGTNKTRGDIHLQHLSTRSNFGERWVYWSYSARGVDFLDLSYSMSIETFSLDHCALPATGAFALDEWSLVWNSQQISATLPPT
eukprot:GEMP01114444.1.p1 GENE.GEMP01114444.1~~GEMP01114444.1.p1  ORF type:complete len:137 (-),score=11.01 GEMP01114444.1:34-444(-)